MKTAAAGAAKRPNENGRPATGRPHISSTISSETQDTTNRAGPQFAPSALALALLAYSPDAADAAKGKGDE